METKTPLRQNKTKKKKTTMLREFVHIYVNLQSVGKCNGSTVYSFKQLITLPPPILSKFKYKSVNLETV